MSFFPVVSKHVLSGYCYVVPQYAVYYVIIFCAAKNNIGVVIALWAPIILVWFILFPVPIVFLFFSPTWCKYLCMNFCRSILWIPRFGMQYTPQYLEAFMVHSVALERWIDLSLILLLFPINLAFFLLQNIKDKS